ncbi:MAG: hypothetical protein ACTSU5_13240 [Promethearchaeota archaeon]
MIKSFIIFDDTGLCHYFKELDGTPGRADHLEPKINGDLLSGMLSAIELLTKELVQDKMIKIELEDNFVVFQRRNFSRPELPVWLTIAVVGRKKGATVGDLTYFSRVKGLLIRVLNEYGRMFHGHRAGSAELDEYRDGDAYTGATYTVADFDEFLLSEVRLHDAPPLPDERKTRVVLRAKADLSRVGDAWVHFEKYYNEYLPSLGYDVAIQVVRDGWFLFFRDFGVFEEVYTNRMEPPAYPRILAKRGGGKGDKFTWEYKVKEIPENSSNDVVLSKLQEFYESDPVATTSKKKKNKKVFLQVTYPNTKAFVSSWLGSLKVEPDGGKEGGNFVPAWNTGINSPESLT